MLTSCALEERQIVEDLDGLSSTIYLIAIMETLSDLPATPETEDLFRAAHDRMWNYLSTSGFDEVTLSRLAETFRGRVSRVDDP